MTSRDGLVAEHDSAELRELTGGVNGENRTLNITTHCMAFVAMKHGIKNPEARNETPVWQWRVATPRRQKALSV